MGKLLNQIERIGDIKKISKEELKPLCKEIRKHLLQNISQTGGHLSSNLGVVELTVALEYVFSLPEDKIVWDVGHQSYIHKMLTGRKDDFETLRKRNGLSGFPKPNESEADVFVTGHSSTSISVALGLSKARDLRDEKHRVIAVIGDGAMTGGLAYEALNNVGKDNTNLIVILNDNQMSIGDNVGALCKHLNSLHTDTRYISMKQNVKEITDKIPLVGDGVYWLLEKVRDGAKELLLDRMMFEKLGFKCVGPVNGHDLEEMIPIFQNIKQIEGPILIHVKTKKGKGYEPAEKNCGLYHGVSPFDVRTGEILPSKKGESWSDVFGRKILELGEEYEEIVGITAAMSGGTSFYAFEQRFPKRFFDVGIAEQHATTFAGGLASEGFLPVFAVYSSFLQRAYDQILHDICIQNLHMIFAIDRAGIVGADGETHQGIYDLSYLSHIPNLTILAPKNAWELEAMLAFAVQTKKPIAIRYPKGEATKKYETYQTPIIDQTAEWIFKGQTIAILSVGAMFDTCYEVVKLLRRHQLEPALINVRFVSPLDTNMLDEIGQTYSYIFTVEDNIRKGGFGSSVLEYYSDMGFSVCVKNIAFPTTFIPQGEQQELFEAYDMDVVGIYNQIREVLMR